MCGGPVTGDRVGGGAQVLDQLDCDPVLPPQRDGVAALETDAPPAIVSVSDIHGNLRSARSALLTLSDHHEYEPVVETDAARRLQWIGGEAYVLVFNGDLVDRGAHSQQVVEMAARLARQAPPGHVRVTVGNHELGMLTPDVYGWEDWYSAERTPEDRRQLLQVIRDGHVVAAYEGYNFVYAHAGRPEQYDPGAVNDDLAAAADDLREAVGTGEDADVQSSITDAYPAVFGFDGHTGRGPDAGIAWLDFEYMPVEAPPQVVGHTVQRYPIREGNVICENVIRKNRRKDGGEAVLVETPERIVALGRDADGAVMTHEFSLPDAVDADGPAD
ncbi:MAG: protein tyrosine phosphatase [Halobacteriales archaeon SW_8_66_22]|nr:MAG: protein tyrosine phosphatase [Halobacteriales archaeon SW_8_66_22]